jgi:hypothetical protein
MMGEAPHYVVLDRIDPAANMRRFYVLSIEPSLFGDATLVREWGRVWTPPGLQGFSVALNENWTCGRVSGLFMRLARRWP